MGVVAEAAIPTSSSLSTTTQDFEPTPGFNSAGLIVNMDYKNFVWENILSSFEYQNLPINIATSSGLLGNTTNAVNSSSSQFLYQYKGYEYKSKMTLTLPQGSSYVLKGAYVKNTDAPNDMNVGYSVRNEINVFFSRKFTLTPIYQFFQIQSDSVVAAYNTPGYETNRVGYKTGIEMTFSNLFKVGALGGERNPLFFSPTQTHERTFELYLETLDLNLIGSRREVIRE